MTKNNASITVEAAYIVPIVLMITVTLLYAVMAVHDRGIIYMELCRYSEKMCFGSDELPDEDIIDVASINNRLFAYRIAYAVGKKEGTGFHVSAYAESCIRPVMVYGGVERLMNYTVDISQKRFSRCKEVRKAVVFVE